MNKTYREYLIAMDNYQGVGLELDPEIDPTNIPGASKLEAELRAENTDAESTFMLDNTEEFEKAAHTIPDCSRVITGDPRETNSKDTRRYRGFNGE